MSVILHPWDLLLFGMAGWINRDQQRVNEYLIRKNQVFKEKLGKKHILLNDDQRQRLTVTGTIPGCTVLKDRQESHRCR